MQSSIGSRVKVLIYTNGDNMHTVHDLLGVGERTLNRYCNGTQQPTVDFIIRVCEVYKVSADYLLFGIKKGS